MRDLARLALLDRNVIAVGRRQIDRRERRRHVERHAVRLRHHRDGVRADLVRDVAVRGDAIGADHDEIHVAAAHQRTGHAVGDDGRRHAVAHQLPRGEPRALQERPRLVGKHLGHLALLGGRANHAERGAVSSGRERARVAVGQNPRVRGHDSGAELPHRPAARDVLVVNGLRLAFEARLQLVDRFARSRTLSPNARFIRSIAQNRLTAVGRVAAISSHSLLNSTANCLVPWRLAAAHAERDPHRGGHADRRRAANDHRLDRAGDFAVRSCSERRFPGPAACAGRSSRRRRAAIQSSEASKK